MRSQLHILVLALVAIPIALASATQTQPRPQAATARHTVGATESAIPYTVKRLRLDRARAERREVSHSIGGRRMFRAITAASVVVMSGFAAAMTYAGLSTVDHSEGALHVAHYAATAVISGMFSTMAAFQVPALFHNERDLRNDLRARRALDQKIADLRKEIK